MKPETRFKDKVRRDLNTLSNIWFVKIDQRSVRGTPDFLLSINGLMVALELKSSSKFKPDPIQLFTLKEIAQSGGLAAVANPENWANIFALLKRLSELSITKTHAIIS